jgi:hypothetical protein
VVDSNGNLAPDLKVLVELLGGNDGAALGKPKITGELLIEAMKAILAEEVIDEVLWSEKARAERAERIDRIYGAQQVLLRKRFAGLLGTPQDFEEE